MKTVEKYKQWIQLNIEHEYYNTRNIPLSLLPSKGTSVFFAKSGILFRQFSKTQWNVLLPTGELEYKQFVLWSKDAVSMMFNLIPLSNDFYYTSLLNNIEGEIYSIKESTEIKTWKQIEIPFTENKLNTSITIAIPIKSIKKYWEFILIPKYNSIDITLLLTEDKGEIEFDEIKKITFLDQEALQVKSKEPILLTEDNSYKLKLWEIRKNGNRLLSDSIPLPQQNEASIFESNNTISTYFYY